MAIELARFKQKGKEIFINPDNVISVERDYDTGAQTIIETVRNSQHIVEEGIDVVRARLTGKTQDTKKGGQ